MIKPEKHSVYPLSLKIPTNGVFCILIYDVLCRYILSGNPQGITSPEIIGWCAVSLRVEDLH
jgi:hypothetical protein